MSLVKPGDNAAVLVVISLLGILTLVAVAAFSGEAPANSAAVAAPDAAETAPAR